MNGASRIGSVCAREAHEGHPRRGIDGCHPLSGPHHDWRVLQLD
jgi:hypothetical protein